MSNELLLVHYNGNWTTEIKYEGYEVCGIHHKETETFDELAEGLKKMVNINSSRTRLEIRYQIREGYKPITVNNDMSLKFLKELKKVENDYTKIPLCVTFEAVERHELILENFARGNENLPIEVHQASDDIYRVKFGTQIFIVDMKKMTCTCNRFQMDELPCAHALGIMRGKHEEPEDYCSRYYYTSTLLATYNSTVFPVAYEMRKDGFSANIEDLIKPHEEITLTGRRKKKRFISAWEKGSKRMRV
ncbi:MuDR family transposase [Striga asiatica]|uniref:MuDR family transposase n=1 Tax=Striga asiatica TaxID=4170 RepID=A0A5A7NXA1_STRAF|nr:MuDR family transposase [Striga asiatica]